MELKKAILERRSVRRYIDKKISDEDMAEILEMGTWAPSGTNRQNWHFVVCQSQESIERLKSTMEVGMADFESYLEGNFPNHPKVVSSTMNFITTLGGCDVCVLAFVRDAGDNDEMVSVQSVAAALQNMALVARDKGIGSCWIAAPCFSGDAIRKEFAPDKGILVSAMTFGYFEKQSPAPPRKAGRIEII